MRDFETYKELLDSLKALRRSLAVLEAEHRPDATPPEVRSPSYFRALNRRQLVLLQELQSELKSASERYNTLARTIAGPAIWGKMEFARPMIRRILKFFGFDVLTLAQAVSRAETALSAHMNAIRADGMRAEAMSQDEFNRLAIDWAVAQEPLIESFESARRELKRIRADIAMLDQLEEGISLNRAPLGRLAFSSGYAATVQRLDELTKAGEFEQALRLFQTLPVRTIPTDHGCNEIKKVVSKAVRSWNGKGLHNSERNASVAETVVRLVRNAQVRGGSTVNDYGDIEVAMSEIGSLEYDIQVVLYWLGSEAERRILQTVPGDEDEDFYNTRLVQQLDTSAKETGVKLFSSLGYTLGFPFEVAFWDTGGKKSETFTGADMCIILYVTLEDGTTLIRGALLQGKLADNMVGNVHRTNKTLGKNHQLISLTSGKAVAYYTFYHDPYDTIGITVVPAARVKAAIEAKLPRKMELWEIPSADCVVPTDKNASDFASFLAITLMDDNHHFDSIEVALKTMGEGRKGYEKENGTDVVKELALNLALISVGGPVPAAELEPLKKYGFRETEERASRWAPHPHLKR